MKFKCILPFILSLSVFHIAGATSHPMKAQKTVNKSNTQEIDYIFLVRNYSIIILILNSIPPTVPILSVTRVIPIFTVPREMCYL